MKRIFCVFFPASWWGRRVVPTGAALARGKIRATPLRNGQRRPARKHLTRKRYSRRQATNAAFDSDDIYGGHGARGFTELVFRREWCKDTTHIPHARQTYVNRELRARRNRSDRAFSTNAFPISENSRLPCQNVLYFSRGKVYRAVSH